MSPIDRVRHIALVAEFDGREAAIKRIEEIDDEHFSPQLREDLESMRIIYTKGSEAISAEKRASLMQRHGWFAELALTQDQSPDSPQRRAALLPAKRLVIALGLFIVIGGLAFLTGIVLLIIAIVRFAGSRRPKVVYNPMTGRAEVIPPPPLTYYRPEVIQPPPLTHYRPDAAAPTTFLESFAIYLGGFLTMSLIVELVLPTAGLMTKVGVLAIPVTLAILWPRFRRLEWADVRRGLGLERGRGFATEVVSGFAGYLAGLPLIALAMIVTLVLTRFFKGGEAPSHPIINEITASPWGVLKLYILAAVWAPISEEIMFRGAFLHHLRRRHGWIISTLIVSFIFAAIHPQGILGIPMLMTIATILSALREWRGSIIAPIVAHALNNFVATTLLILMLA